MAVLPAARIVELLAPYASPLPPSVLQKIGDYLDLLVRWNARTNLTAVREPEALVQRQIGESLFAAQLLETSSPLLDFGSGAGFPGIPLKILNPELPVTLAESQGKKAAFLREAVRTLDIDAEIWSSRVEAILAGRTFATVAMRAVDHTESMLPVGRERVSPEGSLLRFLAAEENPHDEGWYIAKEAAIPLSQGRLTLWKRK